MEVKPSLEYLHGYTVKEVLVPEGGHQWGIEFQNGAIVYNDDPEMSAPATNIEGLSLITTMYGAEDTRMRLGRMTEKNGEMTVVDDTMISLTPLKYTIIDPRFDGVPHTPQDAATEDADEMTLSIREQFNANTQEAPEPGSPGTEEVIEEEVTPES